MILVGLGYFYLTGKKLNGFQLIIIFGVLFLASIGIGELLIKWNIPQRMAEKGNALNPQIDKINGIAEKLNDLERKIPMV